MNVLTDKYYKTYNYTSRYSNIPIYFNAADSKYICGISTNLKTNTAYTLHKLVDTDTLDSLALHYYGRPDLFWVIADFNRIRDPFMRLRDKYTSLRIPALSNISFGD